MGGGRGYFTSFQMAMQSYTSKKINTSIKRAQHNIFLPLGPTPLHTLWSSNPHYQCPVTLEQESRHYLKDVKKEIKTNPSRSESRSERNHPQMWIPAQMSKYKHTKVSCFSSFQRWINRNRGKEGRNGKKERKEGMNGEKQK